MAQGAGLIIEQISYLKNFSQPKTIGLQLSQITKKISVFKKSMIVQESVKSNCPGEWGWEITNKGAPVNK